MAITTVDSFVRIFKFYQSNPLVEKKRDPATGKPRVYTLADKFKQNSLLYEDTIDVYLHSLTLDKLTQLSYDRDGDTIQMAMNAREKLTKYFTTVLYPGSYAYSTLDNVAIRKLLLDWSSTIKTIQDSNRRVTDAYSLSSDDVDKAIRGFGIDFVNVNSLKSIDRRKTFLLNICDLYSIKGTPGSIVKALNIIGLEDIFLREAWLSKDPIENSDDYDLQMRWEAQKNGQIFDTVNKTYVDLNTREDMYTSWDWFKEKIHSSESTFDPHWFYTKNEIKNLNNSKDVLLKLPSITPYFGIEYVSDVDRDIDSMMVLMDEINKQFQTHLTSHDNQNSKKIWVSNYQYRINALECYTALIYTLIRLDEKIQYENFKSFIESNKFQVPTFETPYEYLNLIYWFYQNRNNIFSTSYYKLLHDYIPIKSNTYCSYENVLRWWLEKEVTDLDKNGLYNEETHLQLIDKISDPFYIKPQKYQPKEGEESIEAADYMILEWDTMYPYGRYAVEEFGDGEWVEVVSNEYIYDTHMRTIVRSDYADNGNENIDNYRIVLYHHNNNIPNVFFHPPFNFNAHPTDTLFDRILRYNGVSTTLNYYDDEQIKGAFVNQQTDKASSKYDVVSGYHESEALNSKIRVTQIQDTLMSYYGHVFNYPSNSKLYEDKWMNINASFYDYVTWSIKDYQDSITHNGCLESNILENRKWPLNKKWNWAVDNKYYYINYESNRWMRVEYDNITEEAPVDPSYIRNYGDRFYVNGSLYVYVANNTWIQITGSENYVEVDWEPRGCDLLASGNIKTGSQLSRDLAIGKVLNSDILQLIYNDTVLTDKTTEEYKFNNKELSQAIIEVQNDPFGNQLVPTTSYSYSKFLTYLYNSRLTLDFSTGYIYPIIEGYCDKEFRIYLKCKTQSNKVQWIRLNNHIDNVKWDYCDAEPLYDKDNVNLGSILPSYSLPNRYDSLRLLDGKIYDYRKQLIESYEKGEIDNSINLVVVRPYVETDGKYKETEEIYKNKYPVVYKRLPTISTQDSIKISYEWVPVEDNKINECFLGLNPDLLEWIESYYAMDAQYYIDLPNDFAESLNNYLINELGIDGSLLDLIISSWASSGIVKKIINYYKPKRVRLLFVSNVLEGDYALSNGLDQIGVTDSDFNYYDLVSYRWGDPRFDDKNYFRMNRQRISHVIDDYLPLEDTIYKDGDGSNKVYNIRELRSQESKIPQIEVYDELVDMTRQVIATRNGNAFAVFYANDFVSYDDPTMNGFYYKIPLKDEEIYSNNSWYFEKTEFIVRLPSGKLKSTMRWAMFKADNNDFDKDLAFYVANDESDVPYIKNDGTPIKYGNCSSHNRLINNYDYSEGTFTTERYVKVGLRTISPVWYFKCFKNEACNGFYYQDSKIHADRNERPVYYNLKGKIISFIDTSKYYKRKDPETNFECSKFWIITDNKQVIDFNDCNYFAYTTSLNEELDSDIRDVYNPDFSKQFYSFGKIENDEGGDKDNTSALNGMTISFLEDGNLDAVRYIDYNTYAEYDIYECFKRNHYNQIELKSKPASYVTCNNKDIFNYYLDNPVEVTSDNVDYVVDEHGNSYGAIKTNELSTLILQNQRFSEWTLAFRIKFNSQNSIDSILGSQYSGDIIVNTWYMLVLTSNNNFYIDKNLRNELKHYGISGRNVDFSGKDITLGEYGVWDYILSDWYIKVITDFRIMRNRPEPSKSKRGVGPNNYRPLFVYNEPRTVYDRWSTGLPENIVGGRLEEYWADKAGMNRETSPLWPNRLPFEVEKNLIVKGAVRTMPSRKFLINDGTELESSGDYRAGDVVQGWWPRYHNDYKTGPIHHRPAYVSIQHKIYDTYPLNYKGNQRKENYFDVGLTFDGVNNIDTSKFDGTNVIVTKNENYFYNQELYDENTKHGIIKAGEVKLENNGSSYKNEGSIDNIYVADLDQLDMESEDFNNFIFHKTLYLYNSPISQFNGTWQSSSEVKSWRDGDFYRCYKKDNNCEAILTYQRDIGYFWWEIRLLENGNWNTKLRTFVNAKHNQNPRYKNYDLLNYHQVDLSNQQLCYYSENDVNTFKDHDWQEIRQDFTNCAFGSNTWIEFNIIEEPNNLNHPGINRYIDGYYYHMVFRDQWYKVEYEEDGSNWFEYLPNTKTPSGYLYANNYLYVWIENKWIRIRAELVSDDNKKIPYQLWNFRKDDNSVIINVNDSSNCERTEESFIIPDIIDIRETMWKLIKFNGQPKYKWWQHMGEDVNYLKSVNNEVSLSWTSIQDSVRFLVFDKDDNGEYFKVVKGNGMIDFVKTISQTDTRFDNFKYTKTYDFSNSV